MNEIETRLKQYPSQVREVAERIRSLIHNTACQEALGTVTESLKWGEPSFTVKGGSPVRMDWKEASPDHFYLYFICSTSLVETFRTLYGETLEFQGNRAIVLNWKEDLPVMLEHCVSLALRYHGIKNLPLLGA